MGFLKRTCCLLFGLLVQASAYGATEVHKVSPKPYILTNILGLPITNSMVTSIFWSIVLILIIRLTVGAKPNLIPARGQLTFEVILESLRDVLAPILGNKVAHHAFPLLLSFFLYILIQNWSGLVPGVGTFGNYDSEGHLIYYFRPSNADLNATLALAIVSLAAWAYFILRYEGFKSFAKHLFGNKAERKELPFLIYCLLFFVFFGVGIIETVSILFRVVSLSFRLYGNVFGGENLLNTIGGICEYILPVPFYFLEALIGCIQAFVFTLLIAVYIGLICNHESEGGDTHAHVQ
jgi:F-type H+-transporting ATPase subunit a